jgi:hypothetical protein
MTTYHYDKAHFGLTFPYTVRKYMCWDADSDSVVLRRRRVFVSVKFTKGWVGVHELRLRFGTV